TSGQPIYQSEGASVRGQKTCSGSLSSFPATIQILNNVECNYPDNCQVACVLPSVVIVTGNQGQMLNIEAFQDLCCRAAPERTPPNSKTSEIQITTSCQTMMYGGNLEQVLSM